MPDTRAPSPGAHRHPLHTRLFLSPVCGREAVGVGGGAQKKVRCYQADADRYGMAQPVRVKRMHDISKR
jgi:hypothetical protein